MDHNPAFPSRDNPDFMDFAGTSPRGAGRYRLAFAQAALVFAAAGGLIAAPPATGRMLLLSVNGADRNGLARIATDAGARLVDVGPFEHSLIISGERSALIGAMMQGRMLVLRAGPGGCDGEGKPS